MNDNGGKLFKLVLFNCSTAGLSLMVLNECLRGPTPYYCVYCPICCAGSGCGSDTKTFHELDVTDFLMTDSPASDRELRIHLQKIPRVKPSQPCRSRVSRT